MQRSAARLAAYPVHCLSQAAQGVLTWSCLNHSLSVPVRQQVKQTQVHQPAARLVPNLVLPEVRAHLAVHVGEKQPYAQYTCFAYRALDYMTT